ncbi:DUF4326 domain-containing protein [Streptomyces sp. NPDC048200]|uniref:DUF4326 domain-containing protein n=1 Tax=Streptomyces sp. NPDC048200 TaxID=3365512 RepID=UPI00371EDA5B
MTPRQTTLGTPTRIQRRRTKGWRAPADATYVGRGSRWGNPFQVVSHANAPWRVETDEADSSALRGGPHLFPSWEEAAAFATRLFELHIGPFGAFEYDADALADLRALAGRNLMCWCPLPEPGQPDHCHAAVLLKLANQTDA